MMRKLIILFVVLGGLFFLALGISSFKAYKRRKREKLKYTLNKKIRVEVLNGTNVPDLARRLTYVMRKDSFDVLVYGTSRTKLKNTVVVERRDSSMKYASHVARWYGIKYKTIEIDPDHIIDVSVVIGEDYKKIFPYLDTLKAMY